MARIQRIAQNIKDKVQWTIVKQNSVFTAQTLPATQKIPSIPSQSLPLLIPASNNSLDL